MAKETQKKKHIAFYMAAFGFGGTERVALNLAGHFLKNDYKVTIVTTYKREKEIPFPEGAERIITEHEGIEFNEGRIGNFKKRLNNLKDVWMQIKPDVILSFIGKNNMMALLSTRDLDIPVYVAVRGDPYAEYATKAMRLVSRTLFVKAAGVILQTERSKSYFPSYIRKKCIVLKNPINPVYMKENADRKTDNSIVTVGRCDNNKNQMMLIRAFMSIRFKYPNQKLVIYGDGPERQHLIDYVREHGLEDYVLLPGITNNTREAIKNAGIFVLTSNTEGMPNVLIEAMALGIPCISTDCPCGGPAEIIRDGENGILVPVGDVDALAQAADRLLSDYDMAQKMGNKATKVRELLNPDRVDKEWEEYLMMGSE